MCLSWLPFPTQSLSMTSSLIQENHSLVTCCHWQDHVPLWLHAPITLPIPDQIASFLLVLAHVWAYHPPPFSFDPFAYLDPTTHPSSLTTQTQPHSILAYLSRNYKLTLFMPLVCNFLTHTDPYPTPFNPCKHVQSMTFINQFNNLRLY